MPAARTTNRRSPPASRRRLIHSTSATSVPTGATSGHNLATGGRLDQVENERIRVGFHDPRIHFAINCAARSCPPVRTEAYVGARLDAQLDDQVRRFMSGPLGVRFETTGDGVTVHATKIMDWFSKDFEQWAGGKAAFLRRYVPPAEQRLIDRAGGKLDFEYDDYDWALNDWKR